MENIRIQDDLYNFVNGETLEKLVIPDDKPTAGGFQDLADGVEKIMMDEFAAMTENKSYPNEHLERACTLYAIAKDAERKAAHGITPALKNLAIIDEIKTAEDFSRIFKTLMLRGIPTPFGVGVETDMKNTKRHLVYIQGAGVILPDASYYKPEMAAQKAQLLAIWTQVAKMVMAQGSLSNRLVLSLLGIRFLNPPKCIILMVHSGWPSIQQRRSQLKADMLAPQGANGGSLVWLIGC